MNFTFAGEASWEDSHKNEIEFLKSVASWSGFAASLIETIDRTHQLSPNQLTATRSMMDKMAVKAAKQSSDGIKLAAKVEGSPLADAFIRASGDGQRYVRLTLGEITIAPAGVGSRNQGWLYVKENREYRGKIDPAGIFYPAGGELSDAVLDTVADMIKDPAVAAKAHGLATGQCCCCGRTLTNPESIALGIGPICGGRWGF